MVSDDGLEAVQSGLLDAVISGSSEVARFDELRAASGVGSEMAVGGDLVVTWGCDLDVASSDGLRATIVCSIVELIFMDAVVLGRLVFCVASDLT